MGTLLMKRGELFCLEASTLSSKDFLGKIRTHFSLKILSFVSRYDPIMLDPQRQKQLGDWGFNAIRLGAMWSGVEPTEGNVILHRLPQNFYLSLCLDQ